MSVFETRTEPPAKNEATSTQFRKAALLQPIAPNLTWSMDLMHDPLDNGCKFRVLNIIDDYIREAFDIQKSYSFPGEQVVRVLEQLIDLRGKPQQI